MRAVVTGAGGFAGAWLVELLVNDGHDVTAWTRRPGQKHTAAQQSRCVDIRDADAVLEAMTEDMPEGVFHLAAVTNIAQCTQQPLEACATNTQGTLNVVMAMPNGARAVLASTCHVYGQPHTLPIDEAHSTQPTNVYASSKLEAERVALSSGQDVVIARSFHHTGPGQSTQYALADWAQQVRSGAQSIRTGDLNLRRDYCDVRDIVSGYSLLMTAGVAGETYNLCSGEAPTLREMLSWMAGNRSVGVTEVSDRVRRGDIPEFRGDPSKAEELGWTREYSLRKTLLDMASR